MNESLKSIQESVLRKLLARAESTRIGRKFNFENLRDYSTFHKQFPCLSYDDIKSYIREMKEGKPDILWPGEIQKYAVSAGTTGEGKHLPLSSARLASDKRFIKKISVSYFKQKPNLLRLLGKHISLPGTIERQRLIWVGEVSGFSAKESPLWLWPLQLVNPKKLIQLDFREKFDLVLRKALVANIKVITAVPNWILTLFQQALKETGKSSIAEIWPNLNLLICGGIKLDNYRPHLVKLMGDLSPDFIETYGASEGYFAYSDNLKRDDLKLIIDNGIFYEFIKDPKPRDGNNEQTRQKTVPLWEVKTSVPYAMVVTTNGGLWRYTVSDIIEFTSTDPPRIIVKGRVSEMLDDFGEALYMYEVEDALTASLREMNLQKSAFTVIPKLSSELEVPRHRWLIQFSDRVSSNELHELSQKIDKKLQQINRHYSTRREGETLAAPIVQSISQQQVNGWMEASNRTGAQGKLPKIVRENTELLLYET